MLKKIIAQLSALIPLKWLYPQNLQSPQNPKGPQQNVPTLNIFYHTVSDNYLPHINPLYTPRTVKQFKKDIDFICYVSQHLNVNFNISFDDGLRELYDTVLPILYAKRIPATVFICNDFVDNKNLFFRHKAALLAEKATSAKQRKQILSIHYSERSTLDIIAKTLNVDFDDYLKNNRPYLTTDELKEMQQKGFTIGAHSIDHPLYKELTLDEQIRQTLESVYFVKRNFNEQNISFAFPFTENGVTADFYKEIKNENIKFFGISGISGLGSNNCLTNRINAEYSKTAKEAVYRALLKYKLWR
jgi:peptidoglycan/xylan/chitin deacetylase (PgdA/CDA1 family)